MPTDVVMPQMGGPELARKAQEINADIKILFLSGYTESILIQQGLTSGQINFIEKPYKLSSLLAKVRSVLGSPQ